MSSQTAEAAGREGVRLTHPSPEDGPHMWRLAGETGMDINSPYAYTLWCRDFAATSVVARDTDGRVAAYVTGYVRPDSPDTYFLWQVAVDSAYRGQRLARRMLDFIGDTFAEQGLQYLEATVTPDNEASRALFASFARSRGTEAVWSPLFGEEHFPKAGEEPHEPEDLVRIGPFGPQPETDD
ncbi:L-2,4-diaminobutyric acid acetyltransferase [Nocardiopsis terrae]|uniref:L-2,4-diaminobutyric acid acetyltransferase n=1 Tax=Nocardiopsis terrae TaxID=372655 RepID=A0ABR9HM78_9ACTN|nr:L-2,4-diaminobutyric acid acetyltransferase [Nocardiopsis terrae]GHC69569.1 L-2,4-diaminobutyric acid acetyltransferase [Nocardiopsis terrae]